MHIIYKNLNMFAECEYFSEKDLSYLLYRIGGRLRDAVLYLYDKNDDLIRGIMIEKNVKLFKMFIRNNLYNIETLKIEILFNTAASKKPCDAKKTSTSLKLTNPIMLCINPYPDTSLYDFIFIKDLYDK